MYTCTHNIFISMTVYYVPTLPIIIYFNTSSKCMAYPKATLSIIAFNIIIGDNSIC